VREVGYAYAFSFKYSPRPGTPAADMDGQIAAHVMDERLQRLQARLIADQLAFNQATVGKSCAVLIEKPGRKPGQLVGKSPWLQSVQSRLILHRHSRARGNPVSDCRYHYLDPRPRGDDERQG
jgi:tRNA A37 methylthiotransferase MiaB